MPHSGKRTQLTRNEKEKNKIPVYTSHSRRMENQACRKPGEPSYLEPIRNSMQKRREGVGLKSEGKN